MSESVPSAGSPPNVSGSRGSSAKRAEAASGEAEGGRNRPAQRTAAPAAASPEPIAIPTGGRFDGLLSFSGAACVLGELSGRVRATGKLRIGPDARVEARIDVDEVIIEGLVRGDVVARSRVELSPTAVVEGAILAPRIQLRDGCRFTGRCQSGESAETLDLPA